MAMKILILIGLFSYIIRECTGKENSSCEITGNTMLCKQGVIPENVSAEIRDIFIKDADMYTVNQIQLNNVSQIQTLDIEANKGKTLPQRSFEKFMKLTYLGLHGKLLKVIHEDAFIGLDNLVTLNLSSNIVLNLAEVCKALNSEYRKILPNLKTLSVAEVQRTVSTPVKLDDYFIRSISSGRNITHLDLSELNIVNVDLRVWEPLCTSLESVNLSNSAIAGYESSLEIKACYSLKTFYVSEFKVPAMRALASFENIGFNFRSLVFFSYVQNLYAYKINTDYDLEFNGYFFDISVCPLMLKKIDISGNRIKWINSTVRLHETTRKSISELNISNNAIEYVCPAALTPSENLESLDLSHNRLYVMQKHYRADFEVLFLTQTNLLYLTLSYNGLTAIPRNSFSGNRLLKVLDISFNNIKILDFYVAQMVNLEKLIAGHNLLHTVQREIREEFDFLWSTSSGNISERGNKRSQVCVYLAGNQFVCTCDEDSVELHNWLHSTKVMARSEKVTCKLSGNDIDIKQSGPQDIDYFCTMQVVKKTLIILVPLVITLLIVSVYIVVREKRKQIRKEQVRSVISQIKSGLFPLPHVVFLSYCSEDTNLVLNKIYPQLCECLAKMTQSDQQLVCLGDKHFRPGFALRYEVMRCVEESSVFIAVISKNFCQKNWCNLEVGWAYDQHKPIIMLMLEHVERKSMGHFLDKIFDRYVHASWKPDANGGHLEPEWNILCTSIIQLAGKHFTEGKVVKRNGIV